MVIPDFNPGRFSPSIEVVRKDFFPDFQDEELGEVVSVPSVRDYDDIDVVVAYSPENVCQISSPGPLPATFVPNITDRDYLEFDSLVYSGRCVRFTANAAVSCPCFLHAARVLAVDLVKLASTARSHSCDTCCVCAPLRQLKAPRQKWFPRYEPALGLPRWSKPPSYPDGKCIIVGDVRQSSPWLAKFHDTNSPPIRPPAHVLVSPRRWSPVTN
jgi:hypothetical protein